MVQWENNDRQGRFMMLIADMSLARRTGREPRCRRDPHSCPRAGTFQLVRFLVMVLFTLVGLDF